MTPANDNLTPHPTPFATYTAPGGQRQRVRIVSTTKAGRLGITERLGDATSPQRYVSTRDLSQFLATPYPVRSGARVVPFVPKRGVHSAARIEAAHRIAAMLAALDEDNSDVVECISAATGLSRLDIIGESRDGVFIQARRGAMAYAFVRERGMTLHQLGELVGCHYSTAMHHLQASGVSRRTVSEFDLPYMRALWRRGFMPVGIEPGQMPPDVAERVAEFVTDTGGSVEPKAWTDLRRFLAKKIAGERLAALRADASGMGAEQCAA